MLEIGKIAVIAMLCAVGLGGCAGTLQDRGEVVIQEASELHDLQLRAGVVAIRGASMRSVFELYGADTERLFSLFVIGKYDPYLVDLFRYMIRTGFIVIDRDQAGNVVIRHTK